LIGLKAAAEAAVLTFGSGAVLRPQTESFSRVGFQGGAKALSPSLESAAISSSGDSHDLTNKNNSLWPETGPEYRHRWRFGPRF
jgi:hypothetical protein